MRMPGNGACLCVSSCGHAHGGMGRLSADHLTFAMPRCHFKLCQPQQHLSRISAMQAGVDIICWSRVEKEWGASSSPQATAVMLSCVHGVHMESLPSMTGHE
eukprot:363913-Chlamydomonas_euryale.AAC.4